MTAKENAVSLRRISKRPDQLKNKHEELNARLILHRKLNLTRQRRDRDQTENQLRQPCPRLPVDSRVWSLSCRCRVKFNFLRSISFALSYSLFETMKFIKYCIVKSSIDIIPYHNVDEYYLKSWILLQLMV